MKQIRKIIQLKLNNSSISIRTIAAATRISRPVIKSYLDLLDAHPITLESLKTMNDEALKAHLCIDGIAVKESEQKQHLIKWLEKHNSDLSKVGVTRRILHEKYLSEYDKGLQYTQFCFVLRHQYQSAEVSTLFEHKAGDKMYVDFTGKKLVWHDTSGGENTEEIYLAALGASSYLYALPVASQKVKDFCYATEQAFRFFGGVPHAVVPDCLKSAVLSNNGYDSIINPLFQRLLDHYNTICLPARPHRPKDKAMIESSVNLVYRQILARMDGMKFENRAAMLRWWMQALEAINNAKFQKLPGSRRSRFEETDKNELKALADTSFDLTAVLSQTVTTTGVIYIDEDKTSYSAPSSLHGSKVEILVTPRNIEIWFEGERKAIHERKSGAGKIILPEHRSSAMQHYADRDLRETVRELQQKGIHVNSWTTAVCNRCGHEDQAWAILCGLQKLCKKFPERIDTACRIALKKELWTYTALKNILKNEEDIHLAADEKATPELMHHENIRGAHYFEEQGASA